MVWALAMVACPALPLSSAERPANVLIISVDTLRSDRLSGYGYERETSPNIDQLLEKGVRFTEARTPWGIGCRGKYGEGSGYIPVLID